MLVGEPFSWDSQAKQFCLRGHSGVHYERHSVGIYPAHGIVDCLLYYRQIGHDENKGLLTGILYYYPEDVPPLEKAGSVNLFVDPTWRMRGIGRALVTDAISRWSGLSWDDQRYSQDGLKFRLAIEGRSEWR